MPDCEVLLLFCGEVRRVKNMIWFALPLLMVSILADPLVIAVQSKIISFTNNWRDLHIDENGMPNPTESNVLVMF